MKHIYALALFSFLAIQGYAQPDKDILWQRCLGGSDSEWPEYMQECKNHDLIILGGSTSTDGDLTVSHGNGDIWLVRLDASGAIKWQRSYGGSRVDDANIVRETIEGNLVMAGYTTSSNGDVTSNHGDEDIWVINTDSAGNIIWQRTFGGSNWDYANDIIQTADSGFLVTGSTASKDGDVMPNHLGHIWLIKLDKQGTILWQKTYGGSREDIGVRTIPAHGGGYIIGGTTTSFDGNMYKCYGGYDYCLIKIDSAGNFIREENFGGELDDRLQDLKPGFNNYSYVLSGNSQSTGNDVLGNHGMGDVWSVTIDTNFYIIGRRAYGGRYGDFGHAVTTTRDSNYIFSAGSTSIDGDIDPTHNLGIGADYWVFKANAAGVMQWQKSIGGTGNDEAYCTVQTADNGFAILGITSSNDGDVINTHVTGKFHTSIWVVKIRTPVTVPVLNTAGNAISIYPNPASSFITIDGINAGTVMQLSDICGRIVYKATSDAHKAYIPVMSIAKGIYLLQLTDIYGQRNIQRVVKE